MTERGVKWVNISYETLYVFNTYCFPYAVSEYYDQHCLVAKFQFSDLAMLCRINIPQQTNPDMCTSQTQQLGWTN